MPNKIGMIQPDFKVVTSELKAYQDESSRYCVKGTASSSVVDMVGDQFTESAIVKMSDKFIGKTVYLNHQYVVPESVFGTIKGANVIYRRDEQGNRVADLDIDIAVETENPRAAQTLKYIQNNTKLGISVGVQVKNAMKSADASFNGKPVVMISDCEPLEASIVGIPANQRSWVQTAVKSLKRAGKLDDDLLFKAEDLNDDAQDDELLDELIETKEADENDGDHAAKAGKPSRDDKKRPSDEEDNKDAKDSNAADDEDKQDGGVDEDQEDANGDKKNPSDNQDAEDKQDGGADEDSEGDNADEEDKQDGGTDEDQEDDNGKKKPIKKDLTVEEALAFLNETFAKAKQPDQSELPLIKDGIDLIADMISQHEFLAPTTEDDATATFESVNRLVDVLKNMFEQIPGELGVNAYKLLGVLEKEVKATSRDDGRIQAVHDISCDLGATCGDMHKSADDTDETSFSAKSLNTTDALADASTVTGLVKQIQGLVEKTGELATENVELTQKNLALESELTRVQSDLDEAKRLLNIAMTLPNGRKHRQASVSPMTLNDELFSAKLKGMYGDVIKDL